MLSRCFLGDVRASSDKLARAPPPACLIFERWRKPLENEIPKVTPGSPSGIASGSDAQSIKLRVRSRCQLQVARFYEVLVRPGMLLKLQYPRRSHYAPMSELKSGTFHFTGNHVESPCSWRGREWVFPSRPRCGIRRQT